MKLIQTVIPDVVIIEPKVFGDERGWFMESFNEQRFQEGLRDLGLTPPRPFVQDNHSCSEAGILRGLHYQISPRPQGKLVRVVQGSAFDVAVDIRKGSSTFGQYVSVHLSSENKRMFWIPEGFAHGFVALEDNTHFLYKTTDYYSKNNERSIKWDDSTIGINWPINASEVRLSDKDICAPTLQEI